MYISELTRDQKEELKQSLLESKLGRQPSYGDLADADSIISDDELEEEYGGVCFVEDDFFCSAR